MIVSPGAAIKPQMAAQNAKSTFDQAWVFAVTRAPGAPISIQIADFFVHYFNLFQAGGGHHG